MQWNRLSSLVNEIRYITVCKIVVYYLCSRGAQWHDTVQRWRQQVMECDTSTSSSQCSLCPANALHTWTNRSLVCTASFLMFATQLHRNTFNVKFHLLLFRPPDDSREPLYSPMSIFTEFLISQTDKSIYQRLCPKLSTKNWLKHFAHPTPVFTGGGGTKRSNFGFCFSPQSLWIKLVSKMNNASQNGLVKQRIGNVLNEFDAVRATRLWKPAGNLGLLKMNRKIINNSAHFA